MAMIPVEPPKDGYHSFYRLTEMLDEDPSKHAAEISDIMLWLATTHPEALEDKSQNPQGLVAQGLRIYYLYFPESWENPDEFIPTLPLTKLLQSKVCRDLQTFSGYVNPSVLRHIQNPMYTKRLALGKHTDVKFLMAELERRRKRDAHTYHKFHEGTSIHLRCGEIKIQNLANIPDIHSWLYISDVDDHGVNWVVQATSVLYPQLKIALTNRNFPYFGILHLPYSKLTVAGIEALAKGLLYSGQHFDLIDVSSPYINFNNFSEKKFSLKIQEKYNIGCLTFGSEKKMVFTEIIDDISKQVTLSFDAPEATSNATESNGIPLGSVLCPVWANKLNSED